MAQAVLAKNLRAMRKTNGMTQEELAGRAALSPRHIQKLEAGEVNATLGTLALLAFALHTEPDKLLLQGGSKRLRGAADGK